MKFDRLLAIFYAACLLSACGGGGGGGDSSSTTQVNTSGGGGSSTPSTVSQLEPSSSMSWQTAETSTMAMEVLRMDGTPASGASVRIFSLSWSSPQDGSRLTEPVPTALLDSGVCDSMGRLSITLRTPAYISEVLLVATDGDQLIRQVVSLTGGTLSTSVRLAR